MTLGERLTPRRQRSVPLWEELHAWMLDERRRVPNAGGAAAALDYSPNRWVALGCFLIDGAVSIDNNHCENPIRPWARGRKAWLLAESELVGQRAAVVMSPVHSAKLHGHDPWVYLKDVLERLPLHPNHREEMLPIVGRRSPKRYSLRAAYRRQDGAASRLQKKEESSSKSRRRVALVPCNEPPVRAS